MQPHEAKILLGFPPHSCPSPSQVKSAYKRKVWETHPDRFADHEKSGAECKFKSVSEAYNCLKSGARREGQHAGSYSRVVKSGVPRVYGGRKNHPFIGLPFLLIVVGTFGLGGSNISRAYKKQKEDYPSHNPFLP